MDIVFSPKSLPRMPKLLAEARLVFGPGPLSGLTLKGFTVWKNDEGEISVTFPARTYESGGKTKYFWLLTAEDSDDMETLFKFRQRVASAYVTWREKQGL